MKDDNQFLMGEFAALSQAFLSKGFYFRLIMTDDLVNQGEIRQRARDKVIVGDDKFYYGCSLEPSLQARVDNLVREHKDELLELINLAPEELSKYGVEVTLDEKLKAHLIILTSCGMGFYVSRRVNSHRETRPQSRALVNLSKRIETMAKDEVHHHPNRRKFVNLASLSQK